LAGTNILLSQNDIETKKFNMAGNMNKALDFGNFTGKQFDWNVGINYSFNNTFVKKKKNKNP